MAFTQRRGGSGGPGPDWLAHVPPSLFGAILGVSGLGLAWRQAELVHHWPAWPGDIILLIGATMLVFLLPAYGAKLLLYREEVGRDLAHPVKGAFLGAMPLAIALQVPALAPFSRNAAVALYVLAACMALAVHIYIFIRWHLRDNAPEHFNSIWLIPGVGSFIIAITGAPLGFTEVAWFFFAIGLGFWLFLSAILLHRYIFLARHSGGLAPSYFVPIVPPGLMSMIYPMLEPGGVAPFTRFTYYFALFLLILNLAMLHNLKGERFSLGFWAFTFPLDTITSATILYANSAQLPLLAGFGQFLLLASTGIIAAIFVRTLVEMFNGRVFVADAPAPRAASGGPAS